MNGLSLRRALSALLRLRPGGRPAICTAHGLAAHSRLATLLTAVLGLGLASPRDTAISENRGAWFHAFLPLFAPHANKNVFPIFPDRYSNTKYYEAVIENVPNCGSSLVI